jgi:hypothetical protein
MLNVDVPAKSIVGLPDAEVIKAGGNAADEIVIAEELLSVLIAEPATAETVPPEILTAAEPRLLIAAPADGPVAVFFTVPAVIVIVPDALSAEPIAAPSELCTVPPDMLNVAVSFSQTVPVFCTDSVAAEISVGFSALVCEITTEPSSARIALPVVACTVPPETLIVPATAL